LAAKLYTCQKCRALLEPGTKACPYCATDQRYVQAPPPSVDAHATGRLGIWIVSLIGLIYFLSVQLDPLGPDEDRRFQPSGVSLVHFGDSRAELMLECGQYWRIVSAMFLHVDLIHLIFNCVAVMLLIPPAAVTFGLHRTLCIYFAAGVFGFAVSQMQGHASVGASGAICGLITALAVYGKRRGGFEGQVLMRRMISWMVIILVFGFAVRGRNIDNWGHIAGFAAGAVLGWPAARQRIRGGLEDRGWRAGAYASMGIVAAVMAFGMTPSILRGLERHDVIVYEGDARSAIMVAQAVARGFRPVGELPKEFAPGPSNTEEVSRAVRDAIESTRADPQGKTAERARTEAYRIFLKWRDGLGCKYPYLWSTR